MPSGAPTGGAWLDDRHHQASAADSRSRLARPFTFSKDHRAHLRQALRPQVVKLDIVIALWRCGPNRIFESVLGSKSSVSLVCKRRTTRRIGDGPTR
jgi:hypothetical protein